MGGGHEEQELQTAIQQYEHLHPDIQITQTPVTNDAKILASITGGNPPDIIDLGTSVQLGAWATEGAVEPLGSLVKSAHLKLSDFVPSGLDAVTVNGQLYALPFMNFDIGLLYNKSLFKARRLGPNDPPTTIEQLDSDAAKLTKVSSSGTITQMGFVPDYPGPSQGQECPLESYGWLYGGNWYGKNGDPTPDTSPDIAALAWEKGFYTKYGPQKVANFVASAGAYLTAGDPFESGKLAMMFNGPGRSSTSRRTTPNWRRLSGRRSSRPPRVWRPTTAPPSSTPTLSSYPRVEARGASVRLHHVADDEHTARLGVRKHGGQPAPAERRPAVLARERLALPAVREGSGIAARAYLVAVEDLLAIRN